MIIVESLDGFLSKYHGTSDIYKYSILSDNLWSNTVVRDTHMFQAGPCKCVRRMKYVVICLKVIRLT